jgi:hypothetical protein
MDAYDDLPHDLRLCLERLTTTAEDLSVAGNKTRSGRRQPALADEEIVLAVRDVLEKVYRVGGDWKSVLERIGDGSLSACKAFKAASDKFWGMS